MSSTGSNSPIRKSIRNYSAKAFIDTLKEKDNLFMFIGKTTGWTADGVFDGSDYSTSRGNTAGESIFNHPIDSAFEDGEISRNMIAMKAINASDISYMIPRYDWSGSTQYTQYNHQENLESKRYYVMTEEYNVYKCISNNNNALTTTKPSSTKTSGVFSTQDGFMWKFMYTIPEELRKFISAEYIPVPVVTSRGFDDVSQRQFDIQSNAIDGGIFFIDLPASVREDNWDASAHAEIDVGRYQFSSNSGVGSTTVTLNTGSLGTDDAYNNMDLIVSKGPGAVQVSKITDYVGATRIATIETPLRMPVTELSTYQIVPSLGFSGDGVSAEGYLKFSEYDGNNPTHKKLDRIVMTNPGKNYTEITPVIVPTDNATASGNYAGFSSYPIIPPRGGHGSDAVREFGASNILLVKRFEATEEISGLSGDNDILQYGIVKNPKLNDTDTQYLDSNGNPVRLASTQTDIIKEMKIESNSSGDGLAESLYTVGNFIIGSETKATGKIDSYAPSNEAGYGILKLKNVQGEFEQPYAFGFTGEAISEMKYDDSTKIWSVTNNEQARVVGVQEPARDQTQINFRTATFVGVSADASKVPLLESTFPDDSAVTGANGGKATIFHFQEFAGGNTGELTLINQSGSFTSGEAISISGAAARIGVINTVQIPEIKFNSGEILYAQNMKPIVKGAEQMEEYQILLGF